MIKESYVSFYTAKLLKKICFLEPCRTFYNVVGDISDGRNFGEELLPRPTQALAAKWLREEHHIDIVIDLDDKHLYRCKIYEWNHLVSTHDIRGGIYENVLEEGLRSAIAMLIKD